MDTLRIVVVGDTHVRVFRGLPCEMMEAIRNADWVIHVGDYVTVDVLHGLTRLKKDRFKGVYGNADPLAIRKELPETDKVEILGKRIGITHPSVGGPDENTEEVVIAEFEGDAVDAVVYGHTHEPRIEMVGGVLLVNPGKGYLEDSYFGPPTTMALLTVGTGLDAEIRELRR